MPNDELEEFDPTKTLYYKPYDNEVFNLNNPDLDFLEDNPKELFYKANVVDGLLELSSEIYRTDKMKTEGNLSGNSSRIEVGDMTYYKTGISYDSFYAYISSAFTEEFLENHGLNQYYDYNGQLCATFGSRGGNIDFHNIGFELQSETDTEICFKGTAYYGEPGEDYDPETGYTHEYNFKIIKTDNGWRFSEFELRV